MDALLTYIKSDMFMTSRAFIDGEKDKIVVKQILREKGDRFYGRPDKYEPSSPTVSYVAQYFHNKYKELLIEKVDEILGSPEYESRIDEIANDIIDYVTEGYKNDLKQSIKDRMCSLSNPGINSYNAANLRETIQEEIRNMISIYSSSIRR
jgi:hypothetical protein